MSTSKTNGNRGGKGRNGQVVKTTSKFEGQCTKELKGIVMVYSTKPHMATQYIKFEQAILEAAGKKQPTLAMAINLKRTLTKMDFYLPGVPDASEYTTTNEAGQPVIDAVMKSFVWDEHARKQKKALDKFEAYEENTQIFFFRILMQIDSELKSRMQASEEWKAISKSMDSGALMKLLHTTCVHGSQRDYFCERYINSSKSVFNLRQGKMTPQEFKDAIESNIKVANEVMGFNMFASPELQKFIINKCDDITFTFETLDAQTTEDKKDLEDKCTEHMIGCLMAMNHNRDKSNMYDEVKKSLLAKNDDAFPTSGAEGIDKMIGYEALMKKGKPKSDTTSAVVLVGITNEEKSHSKTPDATTFNCWH